MSVFAQSTPSPTPKTDRVKTIATFYAAVLVVFALAQLYTFNEFADFMATLNVPVNETVTFLIAPLIIICEVFALPFLLRMSLSPAFRFVSMACGWLVAAAWFFIALWIMTTVQPIENVGFLGTVVDLTPGWWAVLLSFALGILAAWSSWGMWPLKSAKK